MKIHDSSYRLSTLRSSYCTRSLQISCPIHIDSVFHSSCSKLYSSTTNISHLIYIGKPAGTTKKKKNQWESILAAGALTTELQPPIYSHPSINSPALKVIDNPIPRLVLKVHGVCQDNEITMHRTPTPVETQ